MPDVAERRRLIDDAAARANDYLDDLAARRVAPDEQALHGLSRFDLPLGEAGQIADSVLDELDRYGSPATMASAGGRYFGFVIGGSLPVAYAANLLAGAWDQNAGPNASSPVGVKLEEVAESWLVDVLRLPQGTGVGFVNGATSANLCAVTAARHAVLEAAGWNVESDGLFGAPPITVIVGDEVHLSMLKALGVAGLGRDRVVRVPVDDQGRFRADALPGISGPTLVCLQAGNVNTGAFDPVGEVCRRLEGSGAWVHVDGAFGLWARACPELETLADGLELANSWGTDAHKWLNVPYDSGLVFVREPAHLRAAMSGQAAYLESGGARENWHYTPDMSRRARGVEIWAALRHLGRQRLADMISRHCRQARRIADGLDAAGFEILADVVLNQVLVSFGDDETTRQVIARVQQEGTCWCGGTVWQGRAAMRISVSSWATTDNDIDEALRAIRKCARQVTTH